MWEREDLAQLCERSLIEQALKRNLDAIMSSLCVCVSAEKLPDIFRVLPELLLLLQRQHIYKRTRYIHALLCECEVKTFSFFFLFYHSLSSCISFSTVPFGVSLSQLFPRDRASESSTALSSTLRFANGEKHGC